MAFDAYAICPCGSGKKVKFCCSKDIVHELEKVVRAIEGDQRAAGLEQINRLISEKGERPALLALKSESLLSLENLEETEKTNARLLEAMPHSPVALGIQAVLEAVKQNVEAAVERLQEALESTDEGLMRIVYSAIAVVGNALFEAEKALAARGHLLLQAGFRGLDNSATIEMLVRMNMLPGLPVIFKQDFTFAEPPAGAPWQGEFQAAMKSARRGTWRAACESLESLDQKVPQQAAVWRNIAILRGWLGQDKQAVAAWRKYAGLSGVSESDAIEAEAIALLLVEPSPEDQIDVVKLTYQVSDTDRLMETLLSDKSMSPLPHDLSELAEEGQPPPKGAFQIFDRPVPTPDSVASLADLPRVLGEVYVYGRQTDREARIELVLERIKEYEANKAEILKRLENLAGKFEGETVVDHVSRVQAETMARQQFPDEMDVARVTPLMEQQRRETFLKRWPNVPLANLEGKSVREAAAVPALRNRALGSILNLELANEEASQSAFDFNELRRELGLPERATNEQPSGNLYAISLVRMGRLDYSKLSDEDLLKAYGRLALNGYRTALCRCAEQIVARPEMANRIDLAEVYRTLASTARDSDQALKYLEDGKQISSKRGESPASWYLMELQIRLGRLEGDECNRLVRLISSRFGNEPGVAQQLYTLLVRYGVINPDGTPIHTRAAQQAAEPAAAAPAAGGLWTPDSPAAAPNKESKLWLPGS